MATAQKPCSRCKGEMQVAALDRFGGEEGGLKLTVEGMPAAVCGEGHKRFVNAEFAALLMDQMVSAQTYQSLAAAVKKGLLKKRHLCPRCGDELPAAPTGQAHLDLPIELSGAPAFKVHTDIPSYRCAKCGTEAVHTHEEVGQLAFKAIAHAYRSIDIHPN